MNWFEKCLNVISNLLTCGCCRRKNEQESSKLAPPIVGLRFDQDLTSSLIVATAEPISQLNFNDLPPEMMFNILSLIPIQERTRLVVVCTLWNEIIVDIKDQRALFLCNRSFGIANMFEWSLNYPVCFQRHHSFAIESINRELDHVDVSTSANISKVLERCPKLTALYICFDEDFVFSQQQLAQDLNRWCPLLEHIQWIKDGPKTDLLNELGDFKNLSCWFVNTVAQDTDNAISLLNRQRKLKLKSIRFGDRMDQILERTDPKHLEQIQVTTPGVVDINRFHNLKQFSQQFKSYQNYLHLGTVTTLRAFKSSDFETIPLSIMKTIVKNNPRIEDTRLNQPLNEQVLSFVAEYLPKIRRLSFQPISLYFYTNEVWTTIASLKNLTILTLGRISDSQIDLEGLKLVIENCSFLWLLRCNHCQNANQPLRVRNEVSRIIQNLVQQCNLNDGHQFRSCTVSDNQWPPCQLKWICDGRYDLNCIHLWS